MLCNPMHLNFTGTGQSITRYASWYAHNAIDCWSSPCQLLIPPRSTVNSVNCLAVDHWPSHCWLLICPPPRIKSTVLIVNHLTVDHWPPHCWPLIVDCLTVDNSQPSHCWLLIALLLTINPLTVDCWSSPPGSTVNSVDRQLPHCWSLIASLLTVDPLTVDCRPSPPTDSNFVIFNILMVPDEPPAVADAISLTAKCSFLTSQKALEIP